MDVLTLQTECKSLAAEFPELRHAVVVRNCTHHETDGSDLERSCAVIERMGLTVIHRQYLKTDLRSHIFAIWGGPWEPRAEGANERFDGLAVHAAKAIPLIDLPGAVTPSASWAASDSSNGISVSEPSELPTHRWVAHLVGMQVTNPHSYTADGQSGKVHLLPWGSFHASALALDAADFLSRPLLKAEAAKFFNGAKVSNPTDFIDNRVACGELTPPLAAGKLGRYDIRQFPAGVREQMR